MSISGVVELFRGRPVHPVGADGRMALSDHLRELRARLLKAVLILLVGLIIALCFYNQIFDLVYKPYQHAQESLPKDKPTLATTEGVAGGFMLYFKISGLAALIGTAPLWLYQIWAFIMPGLHPREKKWTRVFVSVAGPLFIVGILIGYITLPKGIQVLIGFNHSGLTNLVEFNEYLSFFSRTLLVFGVAFEIPVFVVLLNMVGVVRGEQLGRWRPWIVVGVFVFAAAATPSTDPFTMTFMAVPMVLLCLISEVIARINDRRRGRRDPNAGLSPDEASPIDRAPLD